MATILTEGLEPLRARLAPHLRDALKAIVFGSVARGEADDWSDLDLVIVADTPRPFLERFRDFTGLYGVWSRLDVLVYTPSEFTAMLAEGNPFLERALEEGIVVHEAT